jgi:CRP-like cAMP-binding protein
MATATSLEDVTTLRIEKQAMIDVLHQEPAFSELFMSYLLSRNNRMQEDLVDQLFNSSKKRLARILLLGPLRQRQTTGNRHCKDQPGNAGRNGRHHAVASQFLSELVSEARLY